MNWLKRQKIFETWRSANPCPKTELNYNSNFELLTAIILSAQTKDQVVNKVTYYLYLIANTPSSILELGIEQLIEYIKPVNFHKTKAKHIIKTCQILLENFNSTVPHDQDLLESLPGVGRKTANVFLNIAFNKLVIGVDTHVFRVANRINLAPGNSVVEVERKLLKVIPKRFIKNAHHWLVLHGRYTCTAINPKCRDCSINHFCEFKKKNIS